MTYEYQKMRRLVYEGGATFIPVCVTCHRFVKANDSISVNESIGLIDVETCEIRFILSYQVLVNVQAHVKLQKALSAEAIQGIEAAELLAKHVLDHPPNGRHT